MVSVMVFLSLCSNAPLSPPAQGILCLRFARRVPNTDVCSRREVQSTGLKGSGAIDAGLKTRAALPWGDEAMHAEHQAGKLARQRLSVLKRFKGGLKLFDQLRRGGGLSKGVRGGRGEVVQG